MRVLVVDDEVDLVLLYRVSLECDGHEVAGATTGRAGLDAALAGDFDLVLLDMMLPGLDGFGVLAGLRNDPRTMQLPVVIVSARIGVDDQIRGLESGALAYLTKPFSIERLQSLVSSVGTMDAATMDRLRADAVARLGSPGPTSHGEARD